MMITSLFQRKRFFFWLIRAYIKKRKRTIGSFFVAGLCIAAIAYFLIPRLLPFLLLKRQTIGIVGAHTVETLPVEIQNKISLGLLHQTESGIGSPSAALSYKVSPDGKTYAFALRDNLFWQDGKKFTAGDINYNFNDVKTEVRSDREIVFTLKEPYAPFPTAISQPLFRGLIGLMGSADISSYGNFKVIDIDLNGNYITQLTLQGVTPETKNTSLTYKFYPNEEVAKMAFTLGEISSLQNVVDPGHFQSWKNVTVSKTIAYDQLVTVFYNTSFPLLSDKSVRQALTYALPDFPRETQALSPLSSKSWAYVRQNKFTQNFETAKKLLGESKEATQSAKVAVTLTTTPKFADLAKSIKQAWEQIGVETTIAIVDKIPSDPQILLERFRIPDDPDQYVLWHSTQSTNITHFSSPKIDKLLEDGRQTINPDERQQIYADFQKYIVEEAPAAFLYYPTIYTITRK